ncbi:MAG: hypothetical protein AAFV80_02025, partial [Bacteroidota bacterium]
MKRQPIHMYAKAFFFLWTSLFLLPGDIGAQSYSSHRPDIPTYGDLHVSYTNKPFNSIKGAEYGLWEQIYHDCGADFSETLVKQYGKNMVKESQSHFESLARGNVRIACLALSPIQTKFINTKFLTNKNKQETISCLLGIQGDQAFLRKTDRDYFENLVDHIEYLQRFSDKEHSVDGINYQYTLVKDLEDLEEAIDNPTMMAMILTVEGAHALGQSIYIDEGLGDSQEYQVQVLDNVKRLKGIMPLKPNSSDLLDEPILFISLGQHYPNAIVGNTQTFTDFQREVYGEDISLNDGFTSLGKKVVKELTSRQKGRRVLIDIKHMSLEGRKWYYDFVENQRFIGENIPIVASHVGIAGSSWEDPRYLTSDDSRKNRTRVLNLWQQNLANEEVKMIVESDGLIGISLDQQVIAGEAFQDLVDKTVPGTVQRRQVYMKLVLANMFAAVQAANDQKAWDHLCVGSDYDAMFDPMETYLTADDFPSLGEDIENFLNDPTDLFDLFTEAEVRRLMFELEPDAIARKVLSDNMINFLKTHLGKITFDRLPDPSLEGNITFRLQGFDNATSVALAGEFNDWYPRSHFFGKEEGDWVCRLNLKPGV